MWCASDDLLVTRENPLDGSESEYGDMGEFGFPPHWDELRTVRESSEATFRFADLGPAFRRLQFADEKVCTINYLDEVLDYCKFFSDGIPLDHLEQVVFGRGCSGFEMHPLLHDAGFRILEEGIIYCVYDTMGNRLQSIVASEIVDMMDQILDIHVRAGDIECFMSWYNCRDFPDPLPERGSRSRYLLICEKVLKVSITLEFLLKEMIVTKIIMKANEKLWRLDGGQRLRSSSELP